MIGKLFGGNGVLGLGGLNPAQPSESVHSPKALKKIGKLFGVGKSGQTAASISGAGQLLSNLEQLQVKDPAKFKQVTAGIANKLQVAAQQAGSGSQGKTLSELAAKFQNVSAGGSLAQLAPQQVQSFSAPSAYSQAAGNSSANLFDLALQNGSQTSPASTNLQQLFTGISNDVNKALKS